MGNKKPKPGGGPGPMDPVQMEERVKANLSAGRFRKARDEAKLLCKLDRAKYLDLLVDANVGLGREMAGKGMISEAEQVLAYLRTIATPVQCQRLEVALALKSEKHGLGSNLLHPLLDPGLALKDQWRIADRLVVSFEKPSGETEEEAALAEEAVAVQEALRVLSEGALNGALDLARPIRHNSPFAQWKIFIKGQAAFHSGDKGKARRFFDGLDGETAPGQAALAYEPWLREKALAAPGTIPPAHRLEASARLAGLAGWGALFHLAEKEWRARRLTNSYLVWRKGLTDFPSADHGLAGLLTEFYFHAPCHLSDEMVWEWDNYLNNLVDEENCKNRAELMMIHRCNSLQHCDETEAAVLENQWKTFIRLHLEIKNGEGGGERRAEEREPRAGEREEDKRLTSRAYVWLGEIFSRIEEDAWWPFSRGRRIRDANRAIKCLTASIDLDPRNREAHLELFKLYEKLKKKSEKNRLLDRMTERFPEDKEVLLRAGQGCLDRKAFRKGLGYLERGRELDPLDQKVTDLLADTHFQLAAQLFGKKKWDQARRQWANVRELAVSDPGNLLRSDWVFLSRLGVLETMFGEAGRGEQLLKEALPASPSPVVFWGFCHYLSESFEPYPGLLFEKEFRQACRKGCPISQVLLLLKIVRTWQTLREVAHFDEADWIADCCRLALDQPFTVEEAEELVSVIGSEPFLQRPAKALVSHVLKKDPRHPMFRVFQIMMVPLPYGMAERRRLAEELESILAEAEGRGHQKAASFARSLLSQVKRMVAPFPYDEFMDDDDDDDEDEDDLEEELPEPDMIDAEEQRPSGPLPVSPIQAPQKSPPARTSPKPDPNQLPLF